MSTMAEKVAPRLRSAKDIDLTKAKPGCKWCNGRGITGYRTIMLPDPENPEEKHAQQVKLVCKCITRRGGVKEDQLDRMAREMTAALQDGTFARTMAQDIRALPEEQRARATEVVRADIENPNKTQAARDACAEVIRLLDAPEPTPQAEA